MTVQRHARNASFRFPVIRMVCSSEIAREQIADDQVSWKSGQPFSLLPAGDDLKNL